jgi:MraZ protein
MVDRGENDARATADDMNDSTDTQPRGSRIFSGSYERAVDPKGRFNLPFRYRRGAEGERDDYVVTLGVDGNLSIYPADVWEDVFRTAKLGATTAKEQAIIRHVSANTFDLTPDKQGRVLVPPHLLAGAGIDKKVLVVGYGNHLELWDTDVYTAHQQKNLQLDTDFLREFFS